MPHIFLQSRAGGAITVHVHKSFSVVVAAVYIQDLFFWCSVQQTHLNWIIVEYIYARMMYKP